MSNTGGELAERGELFRLDQAVLRDPQVLQRFDQIMRAGFHAFEQARILDRQHRLRRKRLKQINGVFGEFAGLFAPDHERADGAVGTKQRYDQQTAKAGADNDIEHGCFRVVLNVRNLHRYALLDRHADCCLAHVDMTILDLGDESYRPFRGSRAAENSWLASSNT